MTDPPKEFPDEPMGDNPQQEAVDDAEFVSDDGEGNASIMKPRKPTRHHRARDSYYDMDGNTGGRGKKQEDFDGDDDDDDDTLADFKNSKWYILSACIFVISSILYLAMACMIMDMYWFYRDTPSKVYWADDDATWWNYFINCTDDGFFPEEVANADDDYSWMEWYNETAFFEDDNIWLPKIAKETSRGYPDSAYVSQYMAVYFFAALGFMITGAIELFLARHAKLSYRMIYYVMMLAACFGMVSAILTNYSPLWSSIANCISCVLWAGEAIVIVYQRLHGVSDADDYEEYARILRIPITNWFYLADFSFMIGTVGDAVTSFFYIFEIDNWKLGVSAVVFATFWLICALVYLLVAVNDHTEYKKYFATLNEEPKLELEDGKKADIEEVVISEKEPTAVEQSQQSSSAPASSISDDEKKASDVDADSEIPVATAIPVDTEAPSDPVTENKADE